jgi:hypothetical protein
VEIGMPQKKFCLQDTGSNQQYIFMLIFSGVTNPAKNLRHAANFVILSNVIPQENKLVKKCQLSFLHL